MTIATSATGSPSVAAPPSVARATRPHLASHLGAIAQLAAAGLVGSLLFGALATLLSLGVSLLLVLGIGILFLLAFLYLLWATSWLEHERVEGLYGFGVPTLRARRSGVPGFGGWMRTLWQQFIDGQMWRGVASAAIATVLGLVVLPTVAGLVASVGLAFAPLGAADTVRVPGTGFQIEDGWAVGLGVLGVVSSLAVLLGVALLHAVLTRAILVPSQEAQFAAQAQVAGAQRAGAVRASEVERTRIERDLHEVFERRHSPRFRHHGDDVTHETACFDDTEQVTVVATADDDARHLAPRSTQFGDEPHERRRAGTDAHDDRVDRARRQRERPTDRADQVDLVVGSSLGEPTHPGVTVGVDEHLQGAAVRAARRHRAKRQGTARHDGGGVVSDGERDELPRSREFGDARRDERVRDERADTSRRDEFTGDGDDVLGLSGATHGTLVTRGRRSRHRRRSGDVDLPQRVPYMSRSRACSCSDFTAYEPCMLASMACTAAASSCTVVRIGAFIDVPAARIA